ncbi:unnamed protein product, partial [marine sediment metagenome]
DIEHTILASLPRLQRYGLFVWQKQTSTKMFGSYPYPPNIYEDNTIEFINVFVKAGRPPSLPKAAKEPSKLTQQEWRNLTMQVWPIYPEDVSRSGGHPCPFPVVLPQRLIMMYTFGRSPETDFAGDIVLDMFNGTGATCVAARALHRNWIGIDIHPGYCGIARNRVEHEGVDPHAVMLQRVSVKSPGSSRQLRLFAEDDLLGYGHDGSDNGQLSVGDQHTLSLLPNEQDVVQVLLVLCVPDLSLDTIVHHVPVGRARHRET